MSAPISSTARGAALQVCSLSRQDVCSSLRTHWAALGAAQKSTQVAREGVFLEIYSFVILKKYSFMLRLDSSKSLNNAKA